MSYLIYLSGFSFAVMKLYFKCALLLCRLTRTPVSYLLHPLDIIGGDQIKELAFFPGMNRTTEEKVKVFKYALKELTGRFEITLMGESAQSFCSEDKRIKRIKPDRN